MRLSKRIRTAATLTIGLTLAALAQVPAVGAATTNELLCHKAIGKSALRLQRARLSSLDYCLKFGGGNDCPDTGTAIDRAAGSLNKTLTGDGSPCMAAVVEDGVPVSAIGPTSCPPSWNDCHLNLPTITTLNEVSFCLLCTARGAHRKYRLEVDLPEPDTGEPLEQRCMREVVRATNKAIRTGSKEVVSCTAGGSKPFSCPAIDTPESRFAAELGKIATRVSRCRDSTGVENSLSGISAALCAPDALDPAGLAQCLQKTARCSVCRFANEVYDQAQDCVAFSGDVNCRATVPVPDSIYVLNRDADSVTFLDENGDYRNGTLAASTFSVGDAPAAVAVSRATNTLYVANELDESVTMLDATTGAPVGNTLAASTISLGTRPSAISIDSEGDILYVANEDDDSVTFLSARNGGYLYGTAAASTFVVGDQPRAIVTFGGTYPSVLVVNFGDDTMMKLHPKTGAIAGTGATGDGPSTLLVDPRRDIVYVANRTAGTVSVFKHPVFGVVPLLGTLEDSTVEVGPEPVALTIRHDPGGPQLVYVADADHSVTMLRGDTKYLQHGPYAFGTKAESTVVVGAAPGGLLFDSITNELLVSRADATLERITDPWVDETATIPHYGYGGKLAVNSDLQTLYAGYRSLPYGLYLFDLAIPAAITPKYGDSFTDVWDLIADESADRVYVGYSDITYFDGATGFSVDACQLTNYSNDYAFSVASNAALNRVYSGGLYNDVAYCDATTGQHLGFIVIGGPAIGGTNVAASQAHGIIYATDPLDDRLVLLDGTSVAYLNGTYAASNLPTGARPLEVLVNETADRAYVTTEDDAVIFFDAASGDYLNGTLAASSFATGTGPIAMAVDEQANILYVVNSTDASVTLFDATTGAYWNGTQAASTFPSGDAAPTSIAVDPSQAALFVAHESGRIRVLDSATAAPLTFALSSRSTVALDAGSAGAITRMKNSYEE